MKQSNCFFVTSIADKPTSTRCFGYFFDLEEAEKAVLENRCDLHEYLYTWIVIEEVRPDIHGRAIKEYWFNHDLEEGCWKKTTKPKFSECIINWSIG